MRGHIRKRGKESWAVVVELGRDPQTGKRKQQWHAVRGVKKDAERQLRELLHFIDKGSYVRPTKISVAHYLQQWVDGYVKTNTSPRTYERYEEIIRTHLIPALGSIPLTALQPQHIQTYYSKALESGRRDGKGGLSKRTVYHHHRVLYEALKHAVKEGSLLRNVAEAVNPPRPEHKEMRALSPEEANRFLEAARKTPYYVLFYTALYTGLRRSELLALRWQNVDLDLASLSVVETVHQLHGGKLVTKQPKSKRGRRAVALSPSLAILLREHKKQQEAIGRLFGLEPTPKDLVFCQPDGTRFQPDSITKAFHKLAKSIGLEGVRFHDLRHTHATLMLQEGIHPKVVSERLGHSSVAITLDTYSHILPGLQEAAAQRFDEGLLKSHQTELPSRVAG